MILLKQSPIHSHCAVCCLMSLIVMVVMGHKQHLIEFLKLRPTGEIWGNDSSVAKKVENKICNKCKKQYPSEIFHELFL